MIYRNKAQPQILNSPILSYNHMFSRPVNDKYLQNHRQIFHHCPIFYVVFFFFFFFLGGGGLFSCVTVSYPKGSYVEHTNSITTQRLVTNVYE